MDAVKLSNGRTVEMNTVSGDVIDVARHHAAIVEQDAATVLGAGLVIPGHVRSRNVDTSDVWLRTADGREKQFDLRNIGLPIRSGHRISVLWVAPEVGAPGWHIGARNHTTGETRVSLASAVGKNAAQFKLDSGGNGVLLAIFAGFIAAGAVAGLFMSDSRELAQRLVVGGLLGLVASLILGIPIIQMIATPRIKRALDEIEGAGRHLLLASDGS